MFVIWLAAVLAAVAAFNLMIGVFGLHQAIATLVACVIFAIYTSFRTQPEDKEPHA